jgi:hypothetical protein
VNEIKKRILIVNTAPRNCINILLAAGFTSRLCIFFHQP